MTNIHIIFIPGAYVPLTKEGNIVIDSVLASCYAFFDHELTHIGMTPMHWFPEIVQGIFGEDNGFPVLPRLSKNHANQ